MESFSLIIILVVLEGIEPPLGTNQVRMRYKLIGASSYTTGPLLLFI